MKQRTLPFQPVARLSDRHREGAIVATSSSTTELAESARMVVVDNITVPTNGRNGCFC